MEKINRMRRFLIFFLCFLSGCVSSTTDYRISIPNISSGVVNYEVFHWGITRIENGEFEVFLRPANEIQTGYGTTFLFLIPTNKKIEEGGFHFLDSEYYHDAVIENKQPEKFMFELILNPKNKSLNFNPMLCELSINGETIKVSKYYIVKEDVLPYHPLRDKFQRPLKGVRYLFTSNELGSALQSLFSKNISHSVDIRTGFVIEFDYPAPVPGKDNFILTLKGVFDNGEAIPSIQLNYDQSREITRDFDL